MTMMTDARHPFTCEWCDGEWSNRLAYEDHFASLAHKNSDHPYRIPRPLSEEMRAHIIIGAITPATEAGRLWHGEWHSGEYQGAPTECGSAGCGFLGRILAVEAEAIDPFRALLKEEL